MFAPPSLASRMDLARCMKMALVHDMAEALVGDITPVDKSVSKTEKSRRESTTMEYFAENLLGNVDGGIPGSELKDLWQEYEDGETLESRYVHGIDKLELLLQMLEYEKSHGGKLDLGNFTWVQDKIEVPEVKAWCATLMQEREDFWAENGGSYTTKSTKTVEVSGS
jgi:putative hydrolase of HD superfamily